MKRIFLIYSLLSLSCLFAVGPLRAQHMLQSGAIVKSMDIHRLRDSVVVCMQLDLSEMEVKSNRSVVLIPSLEADGRQAELPPVEVMGRRRQLYYERNGQQRDAVAPWLAIRHADRDGVQEVDYRTSLLYEAWMDRARLTMKEDLCGCGEVRPGNQTPLQQADIVFHPQLAYIAPEVEVEKRRALSGEAYLDFVVNRTDINPDYRRNPSELERIHASIDTILHDRDFRITRITLRGYASPEGSYRSNARLAEGRTEALKKYVQSRYGFADTLFATASIPENWEGLRQYVAGSFLADRDGLLALIDSDRDPDAMFSAWCKNLSEYRAYQEAEIPASQMMAYVGTMMLADQQPLYDSLHRQGVMCMISVAPTHDRRAAEAQKRGGYELELGSGCDVIETDYPYLFLGLNTERR